MQLSNGVQKRKIPLVKETITTPQIIRLADANLPYVLRTDGNSYAFNSDLEMTRDLSNMLVGY